MEFFNKEYCVEVQGDHACFTRPEMKVERVSYDVMTPSAARGILQAIFWKPAIEWRIKRIDVMRPIRYISIRRNELSEVASASSNGIFVDEMKNRTQRAGMLLRDVRYRIHAELEFIPPAKRKDSSKSQKETLADGEEISLLRQDENPGKYYGIFERRIKKGQCFTYPYLGCREFSCESFKLVEDANGENPADITTDLGFMFYDFDFSDPENPIPAFFRGVLSHGVLEIPAWDSEEVKR